MPFCMIISMKIIASDYDGTASICGEIPDYNRDAIEKWQKAGNLFGIVTGRDINGALRMDGRAKYDFIICCSGAVILGADRKIVWDNKTSGDILPQLLSDAMQYPANFICVSKDEKRYMLRHDDSSAHLTDIKTAAKLPWFHQFNMRFYSFEDAAEYTAHVNEAFADSVVALQNGWCVDVPGVGMSKTEGILQYVKCIGADRSQVIAVGDEINDIDMVKNFGGSAISGGSPMLKSVAAYCVDSLAALIEQNLEK